jgi:DNA-binding PucR family transcriptional regulator
VTCDALLPERALAGDEQARRQLVEEVYLPLLEAGSSVLETVATYLDHGGSVEGASRELYVHANTVRYRLRRATEVVGLSPYTPRDAYSLRIALTVGRLTVPPVGDPDTTAR